MVTKKSPESTNKTFLCEYCDYGNLEKDYGDIIKYVQIK